MEQSTIPGFRFVPRTGVIYVMHEAMRHGFSYDAPQWANLGQGSPETGPIPGAPPRIESLVIPASKQQYGPVAGNSDLRQAVADFYNTTFRRGKKSKYTRENVSIASGGRLALTRLASALGNINMGHFIPDYTAYEELLSVFKAFTSIPILLDGEAGYKIPAAALKKEILGRGLSALLASNPCNPTGQLVEEGELREWCGLARECQCSFIIDEFYSHYIYNTKPGAPRMVSAAAYVENVEKDPVIVVDGLTKNWRYPGWRISWTVGPKAVIEAIASAGSFLDGGANHPFQSIAAGLLDPQLAGQETAAIQKHFGETQADGHRRGCRAGGRVLHLGESFPAAEAIERRDEFLPRGAQGKGDYRARRVLRRESRQPAGARALRKLLPRQFRAGNEKARNGPRCPRTGHQKVPQIAAAALRARAAASSLLYAGIFYIKIHAWLRWKHALFFASSIPGS